MEINQRSTNSYDLWNESVSHLSGEELKSHVSAYITKVYGWMFFALMVTAGTAYYVYSNDALMAALITNKIVFFGLMIAQIFLVGYLTIRLDKMSSATARTVFFAYAILNGITFSIFFMAYTASSIIGVFGITALTFGVMSAVGYFTKQDLTKFGQILIFALIGLVIASIVNWFMQSPMLYWITSYAGVAIFVGLIAYDTQKIKGYALLDTEEARQKGAIIGALALYLDFINLFIYLLRLFGGRKE